MRTPEDRDRIVGLLHVACRRLRSAIEVLDKDVPEGESIDFVLPDAKRIVDGLVTELCKDGA